MPIPKLERYEFGDEINGYIASTIDSNGAFVLRYTSIQREDALIGALEKAVGTMCFCDDCKNARVLIAEIRSTR